MQVGQESQRDSNFSKQDSLDNDKANLTCPNKNETEFCGLFLILVPDQKGSMVKAEDFGKIVQIFKTRLIGE